MTTVASLVFQMGADVARLREDMDRARKTVDTASGKMQAAAGIATKAIGALGLGIAALKFANMIRGAIDTADAMSKLSQKMGVAVTDVAGLQLAFRQSGLSAGQMESGINRLNKSIANGSKAFGAMGIAVQKQDGTLKNSREILGEVADKFAGYEDGAAKAALAQNLFGQSGAAMIPLLNAGSAAMDDFDAMAMRLGLTISEETARRAEKFNDTLDLVGQGVKGVGMQIMSDLLPTLQVFADKMFGAVTQGDRMAEVSKVISWSLKALGAAFIVVIEIVAAFARTVTSTFEAVKRAMSGDFKGAVDAMRQGFVANIDSMRDGLKNIGELWTETGNTTVSALAATRKAAAPVIEGIGKIKDGSKEMAREAERAAKAQEKLLDDIHKMHLATLAPLENSLKAQKARIESIKDEEKSLALSRRANISLAQAVEQVNLAKLKEQQIAAMGNPEAVAIIQREIDARKELLDLIGGQEARKATEAQAALAEKSAQDSASEWRKASDKIQDSITDALMRGFESGKGFVKNLVDTIKNMFNTMVLRPIVQAVVGSGLSAIGLGGAGGAQAGGFGGMGQSMLGSFAQSALGTSIISSSAAYGAAIGTTSIGAGSQAAMLAAQTGSFGTAGTLATAQAAGTGSSIMASAAAAGPYVAAALLALNALGVFRSKKIVGGGLTGTLGEGDIGSYGLRRRGGSLFSGPSYSIINQGKSPESKALQDAFSAMRTATAGMAKQLGFAGDSIEKFTTQIGTDLIHPDTGGYGLRLDGLSGEQSAKKIQAALDAANEKMARMALATTKTVERVIAPEKWMKEGETAVQALTRLSSSLSGVNGVLGTLNQSLLATSLAGADAASQLIDLFGGMENFTQATGAYYQAFYSEAERNAEITKQLTASMAGMGLAMPESIQAFRDLVNAQDLTTDSGRETYAALIAVSPAFAQITSAAEALGPALENSANALERITRERLSLERELLTLQGNTAELRRRERSELDESNVALYDQITALQDAQTMLERHTQTLQAASRAIEAAQQAVASAQNNVDAIREQGTSGYINALQQVASIQDQIAQQAQQVASTYRDLGLSLREYVQGIVTPPSAAFAQTLAKALAGDSKAMADLPGAATAATDSARQGAGTSAEFRRERDVILRGVIDAANRAEAMGVATATQERSLQDQLIAAQTELAEALRVANAIGAPLVQTQASLIAQFQAAIGVLNTAQSDVDRLIKKLDDIHATLAVIPIALHAGFDKIDANGDGGISFDEFKKAFAGTATEDTLRSVFGALDADGSGMISRLEAIVGNTAQIARNIGAGTSGVISSTAAQTGLSNAQFTAALQSEAARQGVSSSIVTQSFADGLFAQLDRNKSMRLESSEASADVITSAVSTLIKSAASTSAGGSSAATATQLTAKDKEILADPTYQAVGRPSSGPGADLYDFYKKTLFRKPEQGGFDYWMGVYNNGIASQGIGASDQIKASIAQQIEAAARHSSVSSLASSKAHIAETYIGLGGSAAGAALAQARFFATGGAFASGIVRRPTAFDMGVMGEAGPEAIMPLTNVGGSLGVRVQMPPAPRQQQQSDPALARMFAELKTEVSMLRHETRAGVMATQEHASGIKRMTRGYQNTPVSSAQNESLKVEVQS